MNIQHSMRTDKWHTPGHIAEMVRDVLGGIDLDPASSPDANRLVGAKTIITKQDDALTCMWPTQPEGVSVYLNPPGGKIGNKSQTVLFWERLMEFRREGELRHAIFAMFSIEGLQTTQQIYPPAIAFPFCVPSKRVRWIKPGDSTKQSPSHANAFVYVPGWLDASETFRHIFSTIGIVK